MPKLKIQTTETGITATVKYPEEQAAEIMRLYGREVKIVEDVPETTEKPMDSLDDLVDRLLDLGQELQRRMRHEREDTRQEGKPSLLEGLTITDPNATIDPDLEAK